MQNTHNFTNTYMARSNCNNNFYVHYVADFAELISFAEHGKLVAETSELQLTLSRSHKAHFFSKSKYAKKLDILSKKRESGMTPKKREFTPESGSVDTYASCNWLIACSYKLASHCHRRKLCRAHHWRST